MPMVPPKEEKFWSITSCHLEQVPSPPGLLICRLADPGVPLAFSVPLHALAEYRVSQIQGTVWWEIQ